MVKPVTTARQAIRVFLAQQDKTQRWLADKLGCHESLLSDVLAGRRPLSPRLAERLHKIAGIDINQFEKVA